MGTPNDQLTMSQDEFTSVFQQCLDYSFGKLPESRFKSSKIREDLVLKFTLNVISKEIRNNRAILEKSTNDLLVFLCSRISATIESLTFRSVRNFAGKLKYFIYSRAKTRSFLSRIYDNLIINFYQNIFILINKNPLNKRKSVTNRSQAYLPNFYSSPKPF